MFARLIITLLLPGCVLADGPVPDELVISGSMWITDAPTWLADAAGYFDDPDGPTIRVERADSGKQSLERLMQGRADFALMAAMPLARELVQLQEKRVPLESWPVVLASIGLSSHRHHVIADRSRGIEQPADLAGRAVGLLLGTSAHFGWDQFVALHGLAPDAVRLVDTRPGDLEDGLASGRFDAVVSWTPFSEQILERLGEDARHLPMHAMDAVSWLLVSRRDVVEAQPQAVTLVFRGYSASIDLLQNDPVRAAALLDRHPGWLDESRIVWRLVLDWPVLSNLETKLAWSAKELEAEPLRVSPRFFIERGPLERFRPAAVTLPDWVGEGETE